MVFPGLPETSKIKIFASSIHHLSADSVNVYVYKIYPSWLIFEGVYTQGAYIRDVK